MTLRLDDEEQAMLAGALGVATKDVVPNES